MNRNWLGTVWQGLFLLVVIAIGARVVYGLLAPLVPGVIVLALLVALCRFTIGRRWR